MDLLRTLREITVVIVKKQTLWGKTLRTLPGVPAVIGGLCERRRYSTGSLRHIWTKKLRARWRLWQLTLWGLFIKTCVYKHLHCVLSKQTLIWCWHLCRIICLSWYFSLMFDVIHCTCISLIIDVSLKLHFHLNGVKCLKAGEVVTKYYYTL